MALDAVGAGARRAVVLDRDLLAVAAARENAALNRIEIEAAVADALTLEPGPFEVVLAAAEFHEGRDLFARLVA